MLSEFYGILVFSKWYFSQVFILKYKSPEWMHLILNHDNSMNKKLHGRFLFAIKLFDLHKMAKQSDFVNNNQRAIFLLFTTLFFMAISAAVVLQMLWDWIIKLMSKESPFRGYFVYFHNKMRDLYSHHKLEGRKIFSLPRGESPFHRNAYLSWFIFVHL